MLPALVQAVRGPDPNPNPNPNLNPNGVIGDWLDKFIKQKPRSFTKATTPIVARDWIAHIEKIFRALGVGDEFKSRLASHKLEEDAQTWWEGVLEERGGDPFVENLPWADFRTIFFEKYFNSVDKSSYTREYHNIRQRNDEPLSDFTDRFYRLVGFLGSAAGTPEEQAEKYQWAVCDRIRRAIIQSTFPTVAEAAKAAKKVDMENKEFLGGSNNNRKRNSDEYRTPFTSESSQAPTRNNQNNMGNRSSGRNIRPWQGRGQNQGQTKPYQPPTQAQPVNQKGNQNPTQPPVCNHCNKRHPGICRRLTGACLKCGDMGHKINECPKAGNRPTDTTRGAAMPPTTGGRVFSLTAGEAANAPGNMFSLWFVFLYLMADVMPRGHGGDGAGDPPNPDPFRRGTHETDGNGSPKESKGESKKSKASQDGQSGGGGVSLTFDRDVTYTPVGEPSDLFSREAGLYMWRTIPFDRMGWGKVPTPYKDTVMNHLKENFNFDEVEQYLEARDLKGGIRQVLMKRYSDRKNYAQREFRDNGGYDDVESARAHHPKDMPYDNWLRTIDHLLDPKYIARSEANTRVCQLQKFPNRRGTSSYSSTAYKNVIFYMCVFVCLCLFNV
ncbi:putative transcription factor interactor and regulator CCHC(Zn) family [Helianthus annuus]|nr:putative transcription factor interactor and regulator CCHC(Zn) family [Helianthus annuus]